MNNIIKLKKIKLNKDQILIAKLEDLYNKSNDLKKSFIILNTIRALKAQ